jgi:diguanylate cyclase (GGDEF)-like protein
VLDVLNCTVLLRNKPNKFSLVHQVDTWAKIVISNLPSRKVAINNTCLYLIDFLAEAEVFWARNESGVLHSGYWTEQVENGDLYHFEAMACMSAGNALLVIKNVDQEFTQQQKTLQVARETLIDNEILQQQVDETHQRLNGVVSNADNLQEMVLAISNTIDKATFGIMLVDDNLKPIIQNPSNYRLFQLSEVQKSHSETPLDIILKLMSQQYPEHNRIFEESNSWHGELFWLAAPHYVKWLKISIYPLKDPLGQVKQWVFYINDISRIKHLLQHNEQLAHYDSLTELPNRQMFWMMLEQNCAHQHPFYLLYLDIDNFKFINETYGHSEGDDLLITIAERLQKLLKKEDIVYRIGGDEFAIILKNVNGDNPNKSCYAIAERILNRINAPYQVPHKESFSVTASIGVVKYPEQCNTPDMLVKYADLAAYNAKLMGKSNIQFYSQELQQKTAKRIALENALREAIKRDHFEVLLQPMMDIGTGKIIKAEALVRWNCPKQGLIMPDEFIPLAEETGLIIPLGKLIFHHVCKGMQSIQKLGYNIVVSVNLSPKQIYDNSLPPFVHKILAENKVDPKHIELEITETALANDFSVVLKTLQQLKKSGLSISVDDFGTGYSSLAYLKRLPVDYLKIDRSFVEDIVTDENDKAIVTAVIAMAHSLKLKVIAEGVENKEQLAFLAEKKCDAVQGYLFSKPIKLEYFIPFLQNNK